MAEVARPSGWRNLLLKRHLVSRRVLARRRPPAADAQGEAWVNTRWAIPLRALVADKVGSAVARTGVHEPVTTAVITRMVETGDRVCDVGANVGYMTLVLARASGPDGRVTAIEANPRLASLLGQNLAAWAQDRRLAKIDLLLTGASDREGSATLTLAPGYPAHAGTSTFQGETETGTGARLEVPVVRLEDVIDGATTFVKIDVEGHERQVLVGLGPLRPRDVLFEEHGGHPSHASELLREWGYSLFGISNGVLGVHLVEPSAVQVHWESPMILATRDPDRTAARLKTLNLRRSNVAEGSRSGRTADRAGSRRSRG